MARNKKPALTSPWKIGFLVSLLMVAVSIGVGYLITRSFGVAWSWIEFHGTWSDFTFHQDAFMSEMLPLAVLVPVFALVAYLMITGAVRKYRKYLDSGMDYKRLIQSIGKIEDLSDEAAIRKLTSHPELRNFLLKLRTNVVERQSELDAREAELTARADGSSGTDSLNSEIDILESAIVAGRDGFHSELALTSPALKRLERAMRENLVDASSGDAEEALAEIRADLERSSKSLRTRLAEIQDELVQSEQEARELETEITALRTHASAAAPTTSGADEAAQAISRLDSIGDVLGALGEETRSVAIKTALQASSADASVEGVVKLADEVRDVAAKFNGVAAQWSEASASARNAFTSASGEGGSSPRTLEALESIGGRIGRWTEHAVILAEKVKTFEQHFADAFSAAAGTTPPQPETSTDAGDWGLETTAAAPTMAAKPEAPAPDDVPSKSADGLDLQSYEKPDGLFTEIEDSDSSAMFADIPPASVDTPVESAPGAMVDSTTVELESPLSAATKPPAEATPEPVAPEPEMPTADVTPPPAPAPEVNAGEGAEVEGEAPNRQTEYVIDDVPDPSEFVDDSSDDTVITGPRFGDAPAAADKPVTPEAIPSIELESPVAIPNTEDEAVDLYTLGAVDYEPENALHNVDVR